MIFDDALKAAERSNLQRHRTGAAIYDKKGRLLSIGWSHHARLTRLHAETPWSVHAEHHAIERLTPVQEHLAYRIVIATVSGRPDGGLCSGKPCRSCARKIADLPHLKDIIATQRRS